MGADTVRLAPEAVVVAGFTARDSAEVARHVDELTRLGVARPARTPSFYLLPPSALVQAHAIDVTHGQTSGEAEIALLVTNGETLLSLVSDHTDRRAETLDIGLSKLACAKPIAGTAWPYDEVAQRWDSLVLRSWIEEDGERRLYQEGCAGTLLSPPELLDRLSFTRTPEQFAVLTGTVPVTGGLRPSARFWAELVDPGAERSIELSYRVRVLDLLERRP